MLTLFDAIQGLGIRIADTSHFTSQSQEAYTSFFVIEKYNGAQRQVYPATLHCIISAGGGIFA